MSEQKKAQIPLAEMHRAAYASRNMTEKYFDGRIEKAKNDGKVERAKELEVSKDGCLAADDALLRMLDVLVEFEDDFRLFYRNLLERQRKIKEESKGGSAIRALRRGSV